MKYLYILCAVVLLVNTSAESTESKNEWYSNGNNDINSGHFKGLNNIYLPSVEPHSSTWFPNVKNGINLENNKRLNNAYLAPKESHSHSWYSNVNNDINLESNHGHSNVFLPPVQQHSYNSLPANKMYPTYPSYAIAPVSNIPQQQYYYPENTYTQQPSFKVPESVPTPNINYLPVVPQYSHYNQHFVPQMEQIVQTPSTFLSVPYDMRTTGLGYMSTKVLNDINHGTNSFGRHRPLAGSRFIPGYAAQKSVPLDYGKNNWQQEQNTPTYNSDISSYGTASNGAYNGNWGKDYNNWYYPEENSGYKNIENGWNNPQNGDHGNYYYYVN